VTIVNAPASPTGNTVARFTFSGNDGTGSGIAGYECQLDDGGWEACTSPQEYSDLSNSDYTFAVRATDNAGNTSTPDSHTWTIDTSLPAVSITDAPDEVTNRIDASFSFTAPGVVDIASYACQLNGGAWEDCTSPQTYSDLSDGDYTFVVSATDTLGNAAQAIYMWMVDTTPPTVNIDSAPTSTSESTVARFTFSGNDGAGSGIAGYECQLNGGAWEDCTSPQTYSDLSIGDYTFAVRATDNAGNTGTPTNYDWNIPRGSESLQIYLPLIAR
jgi:hypothetical protein